MVENNVTPRGLEIAKPIKEEITGELIAISLVIDSETRDLVGIKIHGTEEFPCSKNELIGWLETAKLRIHSHEGV